METSPNDEIDKNPGESQSSNQCPLHGTSVLNTISEFQNPVTIKTMVVSVIFHLHAIKFRM